MIPLSPLRTDSLPLVSKIYWPQNADDAIMDAPEWLEPIGFAEFAPALREDSGGCESADHPKIARMAEGGASSKSPVWFRLVRLRASANFSSTAFNRETSSGNFSKERPQLSSCVLWATASMRRTRSPLV